LHTLDHNILRLLSLLTDPEIRQVFTYKFYETRNFAKFLAYPEEQVNVNLSQTIENVIERKVARTNVETLN